MESREASPQPAELHQWQEELNTPLEHDVLDIYRGQYTYDLRIEARQSQTSSFTWIDQDESDDYDPSQAQRHPMLAPILKRKRTRLESIDDRALKRPKISTWQQGRTNGQQLTVKFKLTSEPGRACLRAFGDTMDNRPPPQACASNTAEMSGWVGAIDTDRTGFPNYGEGHYRLRKRNDCDLRKISTYNGCALPELSSITLGKPEARGCKACLALCVRCPLLDDGSRYPCDECRNDDIDCELIVQPTEKRRCEGCLKKRTKCSYEEGSDPLWPCRRCFRHGLKCVAGPKRGKTRSEPLLDQDFVAGETPKLPSHKTRDCLQSCQVSTSEDALPHSATKTRRTTLYCDQCSVVRKRWCSLSEESPRAGCDYCKGKGVSCVPESACNLQHRMARKAEGKTTITEEEPTQEVSSESRLQLYGKTIITKLAHPINFNYLNVEGNTAIDCHWCEDLYYGLQGLGKAELKVKDLGDGQGYHEMDDGFTAIGFLPSRMCHGCTTNRMRILVCKAHEIEAIQGVDPDRSDYESYLDWLEPGKASSAPFTWCSVCPAPALYKCGTFDDSVNETEGAPSLVTHGCGLYLCEPCATTLVGQYDCQLEGLIDKLGIDMEKTEGIFELRAVRADADFIHPKGELARRWPYLVDKSL